MFLLSPRNICVPLAANFVAHYEVSEVAKLGDTGGGIVARDMSPSLARPLNSNISQSISGMLLDLCKMQHACIFIFLCLLAFYIQSDCFHIKLIFLRLMNRQDSGCSSFILKIWAKSTLLFLYNCSYKKIVLMKKIV